MAFEAKDIMSNAGPHYLSNLNEAQRAAIEATDGPVLVLAGAGTGKTRVLTTRLVHILTSGFAYPGQILAVTFTNKAAQEMKERIGHLLGRSIEGMWLGTFHSLCVRILRSHAEWVGLQPNFTILDTDDQLRLIKQILKAENIDDRQHPPRLILSIISRWKDRGLTFDQVKRGEHDLAGKIYEQYQQRLQVLNAVDFGDLLLLCLTLFKQKSDVLNSYQQKFRYLLVDEYQDTNVAQYLWLRLLAQGSNNLCCVGDDDQSIYGWRGAEVGNILKFEKDFPGAQVIRLEQNYRSTSHILGAASGLIAHNQGRLGKTLWTNDKSEGEPVLIRGTWDSMDEARFIGDEIETLQRHGEALGQMAVLVRAGFQTREFEERFLKLGIPYRVVGGPRFYERMEIRDALAYLRLLVQPDDGLAFERIINVPKRGIGNTTIQAIHILAREQGISLSRAARYYAESSEKGAAKVALRKFFVDLDRWRSWLEKEPHVDVAKMVLDESGYTAMWREDKSADAPGRLENLKEFIRALEEFEYIQNFLEHVSLVMDNNQQAEREVVNLMTLHSAKGLEFNIAFLAGWEEGLFPHPRSLQDSGDSGLEEERRLGYVGISRARKKAIITYCFQRRMHQGWQAAIPSRFIKEIPLAHSVHINANGGEVSSGLSFSHSGVTSGFKNIKSSFSERPLVLHSFQIGDRVFHQKFGYGEVIELDGDRLDIEFDQAGSKKIIADFVSRA